MDSPASTPAPAAGPSGSVSGSVPPSASAPAPRTKSKMYGSQLAKEGDVQKYRAKYKDLKIKVKEIEKDNDKIILKIMKVKRAIQRVRMERALIYERLIVNPLPPPTSTSTSGHNAPPPPSLESFILTPASVPPQPSSAPIPASTPVRVVSIPAPVDVAAQAPPTTTNGSGGGETSSLGLVDTGLIDAAMSSL